jgi:predicted house-cleaning noncanonical NTP pyrophosphatase (MazG superfamily)
MKSINDRLDEVYAELIKDYGQSDDNEELAKILELIDEVQNLIDHLN